MRGVIENMSWFTGDDGKRYELFGAGGGADVGRRARTSRCSPSSRSCRRCATAATRDARSPPSSPTARPGGAFHELAERIAVDLRPKKIFSPELKRRLSSSPPAAGQSRAGVVCSLLYVSDAGSTPPPPPPPNLTPPPGYAGYEPTLAAAVSLRRIQGLRTAIVILLGFYIIGGLVAVFATPVAADAAQKYLDSARTSTDEDDFLASVAITGIAGFITVARVDRDPRAVDDLAVPDRRQPPGDRPPADWAPGWAIGGWFLPPLVVYVIPMLVLRESWKASDAAVPPGDDRWRQIPVNPIVYVWWVLYGLAPIVFIVAGADVRDERLQPGPGRPRRALRRQPGLAPSRKGSSVSLSAIAWACSSAALTTRHVRAHRRNSNPLTRPMR